MKAILNFFRRAQDAIEALFWSDEYPAALERARTEFVNRPRVGKGV